MADLKVRRLEDRVARALKARADERGVSLEEEVRRTLAAAIDRRRQAFVRRAAAIRRAAGRKTASRALDSARLIRAERNAWG